MRLAGESVSSAGSSRCSRSPRGLTKAPLARSTRPRETKISHTSSGRLYGVVGVVALSCYLNGLTGDFVHDDIPAVTQNKDVLGLSPLSHVFRNDFWGTSMNDMNSHKSYRPLTTLTFRANYQVSGLQPLWFHACNVLLHAAASLLFTRVCLAVAGLQPNFAGAAGVLFAAHPVHTEAVTGVVGRADVLACVFFLLSFLMYHGHSGGASSVSVWMSALLGGLSMLAKETGVTVMLVNLAYDLYRSWHFIKRSLIEVRWNEETLHFCRRAAKVLMSLSLLLVFRLALLQGSLPRFSNQDNPAAFHPCRHVRFLTFCYLAAFNFWLLLCPASLSHDWQMGSVPLLTSLADSRNIATCLFFACCFLIAYRGIADFEQQKHPPLLLGGLFLVIPFLPAANLVVTVGFVVAERLLYIPSLGIVLLLVYGAQLLWGTFIRQRSLLLCAGIVLLLVFCGRTVARNRDWASRQALIRAGLKTLPHNAKLHYNFANFLRDTGQLEMATKHYREALRLWPTYASAHNNLGTLMSGPEEAESHFLAAIRYSPNHVNAHYNLGQVYRKANRSEEAARMLERCVRLDAAYVPAYLLLARLYQGQEGRGPAVGRLLRHVAHLQPNSPDHLAELAAWLHQQGRYWEALYYYQKALSFSSAHRPSLLGAARILRAKGQWPRVHQLMIRFHIMSRDDRLGSVYSSDLYLRSWEMERESSHRNLGLSESHLDHQEDQQMHQKYQDDLRSPRDSTPCSSNGQPGLSSVLQTNTNSIQHDSENDNSVQKLLKRKSSRRKPRLWRKPVMNRSLALRPGTVQDTSCSVPAYTSHFLGTDRSTGTASFNQAYHHNYWTPQPMPLLHGDAAMALHVEVPSPVHIPGDKEVFCLGSISDPTAEEDFSPELMTG